MTSQQNATFRASAPRQSVVRAYRIPRKESLAFGVAMLFTTAVVVGLIG